VEGEKRGKIIIMYIYEKRLSRLTRPLTRHSLVYIVRAAIMREEPRESNNIRESNERFCFLFSVHTPRRCGSHFFMMYTTTLFALCVFARAVCLKGLPDATSITPISLCAWQGGGGDGKRRTLTTQNFYSVVVCRRWCVYKVCSVVGSGGDAGARRTGKQCR